MSGMIFIGDRQPSAFDINSSIRADALDTAVLCRLASYIE